MRDLVKSEKGLAMPLVLVILIVITLLGTALWQYGMSELNFSVRDEKRARAYYLARAGAESVALDLMRNPNNVIDLELAVDEVIASDKTDFENELGIKVGEIEVEIKRITDYSIKITGVGKVDDIKQDVSIIMEALEPFDGVIYSMNDVNFQQQCDVIGNIVSGGNIYWQNDLLEEHPKASDGYTITHGRELIFPEPVFPDSPASYTENTLNINNEINMSAGVLPDPDQEGLLAADKGYKKIAIQNDGKLVIDATLGSITVHTIDFSMANNGELELMTRAGSELIINVANDMELKKVRIKGDGVAKIYIKSGELIAQTPHANILDAGAQLIVFLGEGSLMNVQASGPKGYFQGLVYGPNATVQLQGNANFKGSMIVDRVKGKGERVQADDVHQDYNWDMLDDIFGRYRMIQWVE